MGSETEFSGILLLDKPSGISSTQAVNRVRRCFGGVRAGHGGSLDPLASGVLPIFLAHATRFASYSLAAAKSYRAVIRLDLRTDSDDIDGQVIASDDTMRPSLSQLESALARFRGEFFQVPPQYCALHVNGQRAYKLARQGKSVPLNPRKVRIDRLEVLKYSYPRLEIDIDCSKGTYIRSIARDLGQALGIGGTIESLRRTRVSVFCCEQLCSLDEIEKHTNATDYLQGLLLGVDAGLGHLPSLHLSDNEIRDLYFGKKITRMDMPESSGICEADIQQHPWRVYDHQANFFGLARLAEPGTIKSLRLLPWQQSVDPGTRDRSTPTKGGIARITDFTGMILANADSKQPRL